MTLMSPKPSPKKSRAAEIKEMQFTGLIPTLQNGQPTW